MHIAIYTPLYILYAIDNTIWLYINKKKLLLIKTNENMVQNQENGAVVLEMDNVLVKAIFQWVVLEMVLSMVI